MSCRVIIRCADKNNTGNSEPTGSVLKTLKVECGGLLQKLTVLGIFGNVRVLSDDRLRERPSLIGDETTNAIWGAKALLYVRVPPEFYGINSSFVQPQSLS